MYKMLKLMNTTRRLMDEVKDTSPDLVLLNVRFRAIMGIMEERDNIQIWTDEEGNQRIVLLDKNQEIIVGEDLGMNEIVETWQKFNEIFGDDLTEIAKTLMADFKTVSEEIDTNIFLMKEILENIHILRNEGMPARIDMNESIESARTCLEALDSIQRIFPELTDFKGGDTSN